MSSLIQLPTLSARMHSVIAQTRAEMEAKQGRMRLEFTNAKGEEAAEISIYGIIGDPYDGANAATFARFLRENKKRAVNVRINSPGGLAYDGITIHNALLQHDGPVTTTIEGEAGSAASIIALAGSPTRIFQNGSYFIHRASVGMWGNADRMREALGLLDQLDAAIAATYRAKTGKSLEKIMEQMVGKGGDGTTFSAKEAMTNRYVDEILTLSRPDNAKAEKVASPAAERSGILSDAALAAHNRELKRVRLGL